MSSVGRILIVVNLVLTFILVGYVGAFQYGSTSYKKAYEALHTNGANRIANMAMEAQDAADAKAKVEARNEKQAAVINEMTGRLNDLLRTYVTEKTAQKTIEGKFDDLKTQLDGWQNIYTSMEEKVKEYSNTINDLRDKQAELAEASRVARNREVTAAAFRLRADNVSRSLMSQIRELQAELADREQLLSVYIAMHGTLTGVTPPNLRGRVVAVSSDKNLITVELSGVTEGSQAKAGWQFALVSDTQFKGFVRVIEVTGVGTVICRIMRLTDGAEAPAVGDRVQSLL